MRATKSKYLYLCWNMFSLQYARNSCVRFLLTQVCRPMCLLAAISRTRTSFTKSCLYFVRNTCSRSANSYEMHRILNICCFCHATRAENHFNKQTKLYTSKKLTMLCLLNFNSSRSLFNMAILIHLDSA